MPPRVAPAPAPAPAPAHVPAPAALNNNNDELYGMEQRGVYEAAQRILPVLERGASAIGQGAMSLGSYVGPKLAQGAMAVGRYGSQVALPAIGTTALSSARFVRNRALYPVGKAAWNFTRSCVGSACSRVGSVAARGAQTAVNATNKGARKVARAAANVVAKGAKAVGNAATRKIARLGWAATFDNGLAISSKDKLIVQGIIDRYDPKVISKYLTDLAENLGERLEAYIVDHNSEVDLKLYKKLAAGEFSADVKALYMIHNTFMGQRFAEIEAPSTATATHILMQVNLVPDDLSFDSVDEHDLAGLLAEYEGANEYAPEENPAAAVPKPKKGAKGKDAKGKGGSRRRKTRKYQRR